MRKRIIKTGYEMPNTVEIKYGVNEASYVVLSPDDSLARRQSGDRQMKLSDIFRLACGNFLRGRIRSLLTICSISIGVASVIMILTIREGSRAAIAGQLDRLGLDGIRYTQSRLPYPRGSN